MNLSGTILSGGKSGTRERVADDFYATPVEATLTLLKYEGLNGSILEPACGQGHILKALKMCYPESTIHGSDIVRRNDVFNLADTYGMESPVDFLSNRYQAGEFDNVITNPPFSLALPFINKALEVATNKVVMFCKIQLLEGSARKAMFEKTPLKIVYVFSKRVNPLRDGKDFDEKGKPWSSTMCFAWFVWDKLYFGEPVIRWI